MPNTIFSAKRIHRSVLLFNIICILQRYNVWFDLDAYFNQMKQYAQNVIPLFVDFILITRIASRGVLKNKVSETAGLSRKN